MSLRRSAPFMVKRLGRSVQPLVGKPTAALRLAPSFLIVGAQRCGTTSMYRALMAHPQLSAPVFRKGVAYFDVSYARGFDWYVGHFPLAASARRRHPRPQTFESSGYYSFHPWAASRIAADLPDVRLVLMVRDPVERAYSAHKHELERGFETESFERALELEDARIEPQLRRMMADPDYVSPVHRHQAYRRRGQYVDQIERLHRAVGPHRVHVVQSEDFFARPEEVYRELIEFLGLSPFIPATFNRYNARPRSPMSPMTRQDLDAHFEPFDARLASLLGEQVAWRR
jgi:hypothetical protein